MTRIARGDAEPDRMDLPERNLSPNEFGVFGTALVSRFPFTFPLSRQVSPSALRVRFDRVSEPPVVPGWEHRVPAAYDDGGLVLTLNVPSDDPTVPHWSVLRFGQVVEFFVATDRIVCHLREPRFAFGIEIWLLGTVFAYWLELRKTPTLHAASVEVDGSCIGFLSANRGGKTTLAAAFLRRGHQLVGDDLLPLRITDEAVVGLAGYPQMRMWPNQARYFLGDAELERVQPTVPKLRIPVGESGLGAHSPKPRPVAALFLPERIEDAEGDAAIEITPMSPGEALDVLVRHSFLHGVLDAAGLARGRFPLLAAVLRGVPVRRLRYPSGMQHLPAVVDALSAHVRQLP